MRRVLVLAGAVVAAFLAWWLAEEVSFRMLGESEFERRDRMLRLQLGYDRQRALDRIRREGIGR